MLLAEIAFGTRPDDPKKQEAALETADLYMDSLHRDGQICDEWIRGWHDGGLGATTCVPRPDSLRPRNHSKSARLWRNKLRRLFGTYPQWQVLEDQPWGPYPNLAHEQSLYLFAHAYEPRQSPIRAGSDGTAMPAYLFDMSESLIDALWFWSNSYHHFDHIQLLCGELEIPAYKQLASPDSELARQGREICSEIERVSGLPTYYYLMRHWGRRKGERERACPSCGKRWERPQSNRHSLGLEWFDFLCRRCRLVSHIANTMDDERHAPIGEYKPRRK